MQNLDSQELLHLAIFAASKDNHDDALGYLKQALLQEPENANVSLMLAAEYAEIGMYDRAIECYEKTIKLMPSLKVAQLQLSLLLITFDRLDDASLHIDQLCSLGEANYFAVFALGLKSLIKEDLRDAVSWLEKGCSINNENEPLNEDIKKIISEVETRLAQAHDNVTQPDNNVNSNERLLSTYNQ